VLRKALGEEAVLSSGDALRLNCDLVQSDVEVFQQALEGGDLEEAVALYAGPFLDGFCLPGAGPLERWTDAERQRLASRYAEALASLALQSEEGHDYKTAATWWRRLAAHDPYDSSVAIRLMKALSRAGDPANALLHSQEHTRLLKAELGMEPPGDLLDLAEQLRVAGSSFRSGSSPAVVHDAAPEPVTGEPRVDSPADEAVEARRPLTRRRASLGLVAVTVLVAAGTAVLLLRPSTPVARSRLVVDQLENRSGDARLDELGGLGTDRIIHRVQQAGLINVIPPARSRQTRNRVTAEVEAGVTLDPVQALAAETGATLVIHGAYYLVRDSIQFRLQITDAEAGEDLLIVDPVTVPQEEAQAILGRLEDRVVAGLALVLTPTMFASPKHMGQPPSLPAFRAWRDGEEAVLSGRYEEAIGHWQRARSFDSMWLYPLVRTASALRNDRRLPEADSLVERLLERGDRLTTFERLQVQTLEANLRGDLVSEADIARELAALAPGSWSYAAGVTARGVNRVREAVEHWARIDTTLLSGLFQIRYYNRGGLYHHHTGEYERELEFSRAGLRRFPQYLNLAENEVRALIALGRLEEADSVLNARTAQKGEGTPSPSPSGGGAKGEMGIWDIAGVLTNSANEARAHGHSGYQRELINRALDWLAARPPEEAASYRDKLARALFFAERWEEAREVLDGLGPEGLGSLLRNETQGSLLYHRYVGVTSAMMGDSARALEMSDRLASLDLPYIRGWNTQARARIAAALGNHERAMQLILEAYEQGAPFHLEFHRDIDLLLLETYPPFEEWVRPKG
jgi:tetratricopeptide (TPR) repeat protein